ncbi:MAG: DUF4386 domain-containing protein [Balneolaceae bacterium]|nr:DUF4386 domain-containing protein [Balneolaceae bacterium]
MKSSFTTLAKSGFDISMRQAAIISGSAIVIMALAAVVATDLTIGRLVQPGDAAATTENIRNSEMLFQTGIFSWFVIMVTDLLAAWGLYIYFKPVNKSLSQLTASLRVVYVVLLGTALLNYIEVLSIVSGMGNLGGPENDRLQAQVMRFLNAFDEIWSAGLVVFGVHILLLGYLVIRSVYVPNLFGVLLLLAGPGYLILNLTNLLNSGFEQYRALVGYLFIIPMVLGEVGLGVWLLAKGKNVRSNT